VGLLEVVFFSTQAGSEPVRDWLRELNKDDRIVIGGDLRTVQISFPLGMPLCRPLGDGLYEVRSRLPSRREARVLFSHEKEGLILLHGFIKKSQKTPASELSLARKRRTEYRSRR
jgi:phage-related protein